VLDRHAWALLRRLTRWLDQFKDCFGHRAQHVSLRQYVDGLIGDSGRKSMAAMLARVTEPTSYQAFQHFITDAPWDADLVWRRLREVLPVRQGLLVFDETSFPKRGAETACVQRQHCGCLGKLENCVVSVHLGYAAGDFHTLLDGELYLPEESWHDNRVRCRAAGIPDDVVYRPKWEMALAQVRRALGNGVRFAWLTFDEGYGGKPAFLRELAGLGQNYVAELPVSFVGWTVPPPMLYRDHARDRALAQARLLTRHCANAIRAVHRDEREVALENLHAARRISDSLRSDLADYPDLFFAGYTQDALKEYAEANIVFALVNEATLPDPEKLGLECATYLQGLAEAAGELRRRCLDILRHGHSDEAERLLSHMDDIYAVVVTMDYPDAITGGLRRLTDIVRGVTERTRGDMTISLRQARLEQSLERLEARLA